MKNLIFIIGLPRSGTTLLQRVLTAHKEVASIAEPWLLLPLVTCFDSNTTKSVYGHNVLGKAIIDLKVEATNFQEEYDNHIRSFINNIYTPLRGSRKYFLDKTPRYYLIGKELHRLFPDAKFIYMFRNPIEIYDSVIETFHGGKLDRLALSHIDLSRGLNLLCESLENISGNILKIKYEDFCADSEYVARQICQYLEIDYQQDMLTKFSEVKFSGRYGDPNQNLFRNISKSHIVRSISVVRRHLYARWLEKISERAWQESGYQYSELISQLESRPVAKIQIQLSELLGFASFARQFRLAGLSQRYLGNQSKYSNFFF